MPYIYEKSYDIIVVGAGHAGCEAAWVSARRGHRTLLVTMNLNAVALMPCNPSVGGPGKGHLVRELYALGGLMPRITDRTYLQIRMLNESRGPAVQALRAQSDKKEYSQAMRQTLESLPELDLKQAEVVALAIDEDRCCGVVTATGVVYRSRAVVVTTGPYLKSDIIIGRTRFPGGPHNQLPSFPLSGSLADLGLSMSRLQTATPPRIKRQTIRFEGLKEIKGETLIRTFTGQPARERQLSCYLTRTTQTTVELVRKNLKDSPLVIGNIVNTGPKHCPSIDRKVIKFPHMTTHGVFLEPEGAASDEIYLQGMTTSMPARAQEEILRSIPGLERCEVIRYGYAIEYDFVHPHQLRRTLEAKRTPGLYLAGQICGTTGYEEAATQGFVAGVNASLKLRGEPPFVPGRDEAYVGVLVDDLVSRHHHEPYRMTTSRAEFRLHLRYSNAPARLMGSGYRLGLVDRWTYQEEKDRDLKIQLEMLRLKASLVAPTRRNNEILAEFSPYRLKKPVSLAELLARSEVAFHQLERFGHVRRVPSELVHEVEERLKYESYLARIDGQRASYLRLERVEIPPGFDFASVAGLPPPVRETLELFGPATVGQASRVEGVPREEITRLLGHLQPVVPEADPTAAVIELG
ncbi:MAG: tRNA uridine-5-carboxymethylaminomethyl(34) synthesis enzyme MnmG [Candidatus Riflebacteria bacterium]|nr:tRNA uridine-5-carboxymethylaminomethyl(34) synthesis enzyme MnmG [Candidatus Riflebacteria bacterium]